MYCTHKLGRSVKRRIPYFDVIYEQFLTSQGETPTSQYVEVIGRVSSSGDAITQHALLSLGDNLGMCSCLSVSLTLLDLSLVESLVKFTPQYPSLFAD